MPVSKDFRKGCADDYRIIEYINTHEGVEWVKMEDICDTFKAKNKPPKGALLPAEHGEIMKNKDLQLKRQE